MEFEVVPINKEENINIILGQSHFIKTVEDIYTALKVHLPGSNFSVSFCEASGDRKIRYEGNDNELIKFTNEIARSIGAGHSFVIAIKNGYPISVLTELKMLPEVCRIYAAGGNPMKVIVAEEGDQRAVLGVFDGFTPLGIETGDEIAKRREFLVKIGYKL
ncbi:MAG: adenosine-specific kinase [Candidatus Thermoplasmatota archaeon]|jgi:adenosine/AMP kinase|nr:adenosine-specific kinase [Candidatus Thermoplasmatota archaeon]MCL5963530.1 adenosine-specific kinase [Candidatus Thermoplasmatota archaeon]